MGIKKLEVVGKYSCIETTQESNEKLNSIYGNNLGLYYNLKNINCSDELIKCKISTEDDTARCVIRFVSREAYQKTEDDKENETLLCIAKSSIRELENCNYKNVGYFQLNDQCDRQIDISICSSRGVANDHVFKAIDVKENSTQNIYYIRGFATASQAIDAGCNYGSTGYPAVFILTKTDIVPDTYAMDINGISIGKINAYGDICCIRRNELSFRTEYGDCCAADYYVPYVTFSALGSPNYWYCTCTAYIPTKYFTECHNVVLRCYFDYKVVEQCSAYFDYYKNQICYGGRLIKLPTTFTCITQS